MTNQAGFSPEQEDVLRKAEKLMRLAAKNPNENEAASATAKAMELLAAYNLSTAALEASGASDSGKRAEEKIIGGFYEFERDLWQAIAELNFCWYWTQVKFIKWEDRKKHRNRMWTHQHVLIGRTVNIAGTKAMAGYLMQTIERITKEQLEDRGKLHPRSSWAVSFRRGMAERIQEKVEDRRYQILTEERRKAREARERAAGSASTETALTLSSVIQSEYEANYDFKYGEGAYAEMQEDRRRAAEARKRAEEEYTRWAAAHPEEAAAEEKKRREEEEKADRRRRSRGSGGSVFRGDWSAYAMGREAGEKVGIDPQTSNQSASTRLLS